MSLKWARALGLQIAIGLAAGLLASLAQGWNAALNAAALWFVAPLAGLMSACLARRMGLNGYLAWLAPPICLYAAHALLWGYPPPAGPTLLTALAALFGAAAGEVLERRGQGARHGRKKRS